MAENEIALSNVVSREEWRAERKKLLGKEKEVTRARDALNAERQRQPMVEIEGVKYPHTIN